MDVSMPRLDGLDSTRALRRLLPNVQVVAVAEYEDVPGLLKETLAAGATTHVSKVALRDDLVSTLRNL